MAFEVAEWEKLFWFLRYLIPGLHVNSKSDENIKDLLDSVDLNTYGLRRTALNEKIVLDAGESIIEPNKPVMVNAGDDKDVVKGSLDEILKEFNERWFRDWQAIPEDQKTKLVSIVKAVKENEQYREFVVGNPDPQTSSDKMNEILDSVVRQKRKSDNSLYKSYLQNEAFKADFRNLIIRMLDNLDYLQ